MNECMHLTCAIEGFECAYRLLYIARNLQRGADCCSVHAREMIYPFEILAYHLALQLEGEPVGSAVSTLSDDFNTQSKGSSLPAFNQPRPERRLYGRDVESGSWESHEEVSVMSEGRALLDGVHLLDHWRMLPECGLDRRFFREKWLCQGRARDRRHDDASVTIEPNKGAG